MNVERPSSRRRPVRAARGAGQCLRPGARRVGLIRSPGRCAPGHATRRESTFAARVATGVGPTTRLGTPPRSERGRLGPYARVSRPSPALRLPRCRILTVSARAAASLSSNIGTSWPVRRSRSHRFTRLRMDASAIKLRRLRGKRSATTFWRRTGHIGHAYAFRSGRSHPQGGTATLWLSAYGDPLTRVDNATAVSTRDFHTGHRNPSSCRSDTSIRGLMIRSLERRRSVAFTRENDATQWNSIP